MPMTCVIIELGKFSTVKLLGRYQGKALVVKKVVVAGDGHVVVDSQQLGERIVRIVGVVDGDKAVALRPR